MENIIEDLLRQLIDEAMKAKKNANDDFDRGIVWGYYFSISKILNQANAFGIYDKLSSKVKDFSPESLLD